MLQAQLQALDLPPWLPVVLALVTALRRERSLLPLWAERWTLKLQDLNPPLVGPPILPQALMGILLQPLTQARCARLGLRKVALQRLVGTQPVSKTLDDGPLLAALPPARRCDAALSVAWTWLSAWPVTAEAQARVCGSAKGSTRLVFSTPPGCLVSAARDLPQQEAAESLTEGNKGRQGDSHLHSTDQSQQGQSVPPQEALAGQLEACAASRKPCPPCPLCGSSMPRAVVPLLDVESDRLCPAGTCPSSRICSSLASHRPCAAYPLPPPWAAAVQLEESGEYPASSTRQ